MSDFVLNTDSDLHTSRTDSLWADVGRLKQENLDLHQMLADQKSLLENGIQDNNLVIEEVLNEEIESLKRKQSELEKETKRLKTTLLSYKQTGSSNNEDQPEEFDNRTALSERNSIQIALTQLNSRVSEIEVAVGNLTTELKPDENNGPVGRINYPGSILSQLFTEIDKFLSPNQDNLATNFQNFEQIKNEIFETTEDQPSSSFTVPEPAVTAIKPDYENINVAGDAEAPVLEPMEEASICMSDENSEESSMQIRENGEDSQLEDPLVTPVTIEVHGVTTSVKLSLSPTTLLYPCTPNRSEEDLITDNVCSQSTCEVDESLNFETEEDQESEVGSSSQSSETSCSVVSILEEEVERRQKCITDYFSNGKWTIKLGYFPDLKRTLIKHLRPLQLPVNYKPPNETKIENVLTEVLNLLNSAIDNDENVCKSITKSGTFLHFLMPYKKASIITPLQFHFLVKALVHKKCFQIFNEKGYYGESILHRAVRKMMVLKDTLQLLHSIGVNFNATTSYGNPVLFESLQLDTRKSFIVTLIGFGADWLACNDKEGTNVIHQAAGSCGNHEVLKYLLSLEGVSVNAVNRAGDTPLHLCVRAIHHSKIKAKVRVLLKSGADIKIKDKNGLTPLECLRRVLKQNKKTDPELEKLLGARNKK